MDFASYSHLTKSYNIQYSNQLNRVCLCPFDMTSLLFFKILYKENCCKEKCLLLIFDIKRGFIMKENVARNEYRNSSDVDMNANCQLFRIFDCRLLCKFEGILFFNQFANNIESKTDRNNCFSNSYSKIPSECLLIFTLLTPQLR